jgi:uncharacterized protein (TIGR00252 family)
VSSTEVGRDAESLVAEHLKTQQHKVVVQNWRTRWCEIDIVSTYKKCVYFTEVKYRSSSAWGSGFDYITEKKLRQMRFAAEFWLADNKWQGEACLQVAEVNASGECQILEL